MSVNRLAWRLTTVLFPLIFFYNLSIAQENGNNNSRNYIEVDTSDYVPLWYSWAINYNLMIAASKGLADEVDRLVENGANVNYRTDDRLTPLIIATEYNKIESVKAILKHSPLLDDFTIYSETALIIAAKMNYLDIAEALIRAGAQINLADSKGVAPLHYASLYGYAEMTDMLLYYEAQINQKTNDGFSALHAAIYSGYAEVTDILIQYEANMESRDNDGNTPFLIAASFGDTLIMNMLYKYGVDIYADNNYGHNALALAIAFDHREAVKYLLQIGDKWSENSSPELNPYKVAAKYGRKDIVNILNENNIQGTHKLSFDQAAFSIYTRFTKHNFYSGLSLSLREPYLNAGITAGLNTKLWETRLLVQKSPSVFYQYVDKSSMVFAGLFKDFIISENTNNKRLIFSTSLSAGYTFGNKFKGTEISPEKKTVIIPSVAVKWATKPVTFFAGADYCNLGYYKAGSVWATIGLSYNFYFDNMQFKQKKIKWN